MILRKLRTALTPSATSPTARMDWRWSRIDEYPYGHHTEAVDDIRRYRERGEDERAESLLLWCLDFAETEAQVEYFMDIPPVYYLCLANLYRERDDRLGEIWVLEQYVEVTEEIGGRPRQRLVDRLDDVRARAAVNDRPSFAARAEVMEHVRLRVTGVLATESLANRS